MVSDSGLASLLQGSQQRNLEDTKQVARVDEQKPALLANMTPFGLIHEACGKEQVLNARMDFLAQFIHEAFIERRKEEGRSPNDPSMRPWEQLEQDFIDSNRQQADHIPVKLRAIGCYSSDKPGGESFENWNRETVELLAKMEHARWTAERHLAGWKFASAQVGAPDALKAGKLSPLLIDWDKLDEDTREWDRETV